ncbi:MAG: restriction endonuclease subunit S [Flavobacteriaceae bacterium]
MKEGWEMRKLGNICDIQLGKTPPRKSPKYWDIDKETQNVWLSIADMVHGEIISESKEYISDLGKQLFNITPEGTLMLTFKLTLGRVSFAGKDLLTNEAIASLINLKEDVNKKYLFYYFTFFDWNKATEGDFKVKGRTLNKKKLNQLQIPIPPLPEQKQIVAILDKAFAAIDKAKANIEKNIENAKELFQSKLNQIFSQKEEGWNLIKVKDIGKVQTGTTPPTKDSENYGNFIPFVKPAHFYNSGELNPQNSFLSEIGIKKGRLINKKSVLMVCIGATIGKTGFTDKEISCNQQINTLTPKISYNYKFIYYGMISNRFQKEVLVNGKSAQATLPIINKSKWENLKLNVNTSIEIQGKIVTQLNQLQSQTQQLAEKYNQKLTNLEEFKKSILQKAFAGELTKKQLSV